MKASELRENLESGILGTYKASSVDNMLSIIESRYKKDFAKLKNYESDIQSKNKLIDELKADLTVAQEELFAEKAKSSQVDQRAIFIIEKEREIDIKVKEVERQCDERIAEIGKKGQEHLQLANEKANDIIAKAKAKADDIIENAKQVANFEIDKANEMVEKIKTDFDASNVQLIKKQGELVSGVENLLSLLEAFDFDSNIKADIEYIEAEKVDFDVDLPDVSELTAKNEAEVEFESTEVAQAPVVEEIPVLKKSKRPVKPTYKPEVEN